MRVINLLRVSLRFADHYYSDLPFLQASDIVRRAALADQYGFVALARTMNSDPWLSGIVSFVSGPLTRAKPPTDADWERPLDLVRSADHAFRLGDNQGAINFLKSAVNAFNSTHRKFLDYFSGCTESAERGKVVLEITNTVLIAVASGGIGEAPMVVRAGVAAFLKAYQSSMTEGGQVLFDVEGKIDWSNVGAEFLKEFAASLIGGALAGQFRAIVAPRFVTRVTKQPVEGWLKQAIQGLARKGRLPNAMMNWQGTAVALGARELAQLAAALLLEGMVRVARLREEKLSAKQFMQVVLDDWGNEEMEIFAKFLKFDSEFRPPEREPAPAAH